MKPRNRTYRNAKQTFRDGRVWRTEMPGTGLIREDVGAPIYTSGIDPQSELVHDPALAPAAPSHADPAVDAFADARRKFRQRHLRPVTPE